MDTKRLIRAARRVVRAAHEALDVAVDLDRAIKSLDRAIADTPRQPAGPIVITVEGGLVQGISSDDPKLVGKKVTVIDYDSEGADADEIEHVPQGKGETEEATISAHEVGVLFKPVAKFLKKRPVKAKATVCTQCGKSFFIKDNGVSHHVSKDSPDGIDHEADADHVPYGEGQA